MSSVTETTSLTAAAPAWVTATAPVVVTVDAVLAEQLTIAADPAVGSSVRVYGARASGSTVTVTCPVASPGAVGYIDAASWECLVSGLPQGYSTITASDGTSTAQVEVPAGEISAAPSVNAIPSPTSDDPIIVSGRVPSYLEGGASGSAVASGNLVIPVVLQGSVAGSATASADLSTPARLVGAADGIASASGDLTVTVVLEPTAEPHVTAIPSPTSADPIVISGIVPPWAVLEGGALGTGEATGDLVALTLGGDAVAGSDAAADLTAQAVHALSGDAVASSAAALASGTHTFPAVDVLLSAAERTVYLHHGRVDVVLSASERTVILERRVA